MALTQQQRTIRYTFRRRALIAALGGRCVKCGKKTKWLEFHHKDQRTRTWQANRTNCLRRIKLYERDAEAGLLELNCHDCHPRPGKKYDDVTIPD